MSSSQQSPPPPAPPAPFQKVSFPLVLLKPNQPGVECILEVGETLRLVRANGVQLFRFQYSQVKRWSASKDGRDLQLQVSLGNASGHLKFEPTRPDGGATVKAAVDALQNVVQNLVTKRASVARTANDAGSDDLDENATQRRRSSNKTSSSSVIAEQQMTTQQHPMQPPPQPPPPPQHAAAPTPPVPPQRTTSPPATGAPTPTNQMPAAVKRLSTLERVKSIFRRESTTAKSDSASPQGSEDFSYQQLKHNAEVATQNELYQAHLDSINKQRLEPDMVAKLKVATARGKARLQTKKKMSVGGDETSPPNPEPRTPLWPSVSSEAGSPVPAGPSSSAGSKWLQNSPSQPSQEASPSPQPVSGLTRLRRASQAAMAENAPTPTTVDTPPPPPIATPSAPDPRIEDLESALRAAQQEMDDLRAAASAKPPPPTPPTDDSSEVRKLTEEVARLSKQLADSEAANKVMQTDVAETKSAAAARARERDTARDRVIMLERTKVDFEAAKTRASDEIATLKREKTKLERDLVDAQANANSGPSEEILLQKEQEHEAALAKLRGEKEIAETQLGEQMAMAAQSDDDLNATRYALEQANAKLANSEKELASVRADLDEVGAEALANEDVTVGELARLRAQVGELERERDGALNHRTAAEDRVKLLEDEPAAVSRQSNPPSKPDIARSIAQVEQLTAECSISLRLQADAGVLKDGVVPFDSSWQRSDRPSKTRRLDQDDVSRLVLIMANDRAFSVVPSEELSSMVSACATVQTFNPSAVIHPRNRPFDAAFFVRAGDVHKVYDDVSTSGVPLSAGESVLVEAAVRRVPASCTLRVQGDEAEVYAIDIDAMCAHFSDSSHQRYLSDLRAVSSDETDTPTSLRVCTDGSSLRRAYCALAALLAGGADGASEVRVKELEASLAEALESAHAHAAASGETSTSLDEVTTQLVAMEKARSLLESALVAERAHNASLTERLAERESELESAEIRAGRAEEAVERLRANSDGKDEQDLFFDGQSKQKSDDAFAAAPSPEPPASPSVSLAVSDATPISTLPRWARADSAEFRQLLNRANKVLGDEFDESSFASDAEALASRLVRTLDVLANAQERIERAEDEHTTLQWKLTAAEQRAEDAASAEAAARHVADEATGRNARLIEELEEKNAAYLREIDSSRAEREQLLDAERERMNASVLLAERDAAREECRVLRTTFDQAQHRLVRAEDEASEKSKETKEAMAELVKARRDAASAAAEREAAKIEVEEVKASCRKALLRLKEHELRGEASVCGEKRVFACTNAEGSKIAVSFDAGGIEVYREGAKSSEDPIFRAPVEDIVRYNLHAGHVTLATRQRGEISLLCPRTDSVALVAALHLHLELNSLDGVSCELIADSLLDKENDREMANMQQEVQGTRKSTTDTNNGGDGSAVDPGSILGIASGLDSLTKQLEAKLGRSEEPAYTAPSMSAPQLVLAPPSPLAVRYGEPRAADGGDVVRLRRSLLKAREQASTAQAVNEQLKMRLADLEAGAINAMRDARKMLAEFASESKLVQSDPPVDARHLASSISSRIAEASERIAGLAVQEGVLCHAAVRELEAIWRTRVEKLIEASAAADEDEDEDEDEAEGEDHGTYVATKGVDANGEVRVMAHRPATVDIEAHVKPLRERIAELTDELSAARAEAEKCGAARDDIEVQLRAAESEVKRLSVYADELEAARARMEVQCVDLQKQLEREAELSADVLLPDLEARARHTQQENAWRAAEERWKAEKRILEERLVNVSSVARREEDSARAAIDAGRKLQEENERLRREGLGVATVAAAAASVRASLDSAPTPWTTAAVVAGTPRLHLGAPPGSVGVASELAATPATAPPGPGRSSALPLAPTTATVGRTRGRSLAAQSKVLGLVGEIHKSLVDSNTDATSVATPWLTSSSSANTFGGGGGASTAPPPLPGTSGRRRALLVTPSSSGGYANGEGTGGGGGGYFVRP
ncbi:hypothetical protein RI054_41g148220 [Pseudoscourfieldia marina]